MKTITRPINTANLQNPEKRQENELALKEKFEQLQLEQRPTEMGESC